MSLSRYRNKRDPGRTNEPFSAEHDSRTTETWAGSFVVHQHDARRMHWDLRIQVGNRLRSFAVPKGPSLDPSVKRLAVNTEDHPLAYLDFEDVIPAGNYGAGAMIVWDRGGVRYLEASAEQGGEAGKLDFVLEGFKLRGRFALIATSKRRKKGDTSQDEWLLVKKPDEHAKPDWDIAAAARSVLSGLHVEELNQRLEIAQSWRARAVAIAGRGQHRKSSSPVVHPQVPMVCSVEGAPIRSKDWLYELKLDGVRVVATKTSTGTSLSYRSGRVATPTYPEIVRALDTLPVEHIVFDGEIVTFDELGHTSFQRLGQRIHARRPRDIERVKWTVPVVYLVFDVLAVEGVDVRHAPLEERKTVLEEVLRGQGFVRRLDHLVERGDALWDLVERERLEGLVAKRRSSPYAQGPAPSPHWVKKKRAQEAEFVVTAWTPGKAQPGSLGALRIASYSGHELVERGGVGSGIDAGTRRELKERLAKLALPGDGGCSKPDARAVRPELVVRVRFMGFSEAGHLRMPTFLGIRDDVDARSCRVAPSWERLEQAMPKAAALIERATRVEITNPDKVFWTDEGLTKGDLLGYYDAVAPAMLPFLHERPVVLVRYPDGISGKSFFQWRVPRGVPDWVGRMELHDPEEHVGRGQGKEAFLVGDADSLVYLANLGCIPIHVLAYRRQTQDRCDFLTVDFDLGDRSFRDAVVLALSLRELLDELSLPGFVKTSGQRGLHVLVPLGPGLAFPSAKLLCELLGRLVVGRHPELATMQRVKEKRGNKVYVDTGQTGPSRTIVAPYSVRAVPGATVSTPLAWDELHLALDPRAFDLGTVQERVEQQVDPWRGFFDQQPDLETTMATLARWTAAQGQS